jgi:1,4-dihydroxy-2-naphthoyl-CoA synthase
MADQAVNMMDTGDYFMIRTVFSVATLAIVLGAITEAFAPFVVDPFSSAFCAAVSTSKLVIILITVEISVA